jgi:ABC-type transport system involved in multi-copper enzyme maturation permease subunit
MTAPETIYAFRWLIWDTFRQSLANRIFWLMLGVSALVIAVCLSVSVEGGESLLPPGEELELQPAHGHISLGFGAFPVALFRDGQAAVHFLLMLLAEWVAGAGGVLLALSWTAGFLPGFLEPRAATVLLAKPVPRWALLAGKFLGVLALVGLQLTIFIGGTWMALGLRTGFWVSSYLLGIPVVLIHFAAFFSFSTLLAVVTRSTLACILGSILFWFMCWGANDGRHFLVALPYLDPSSPPMPAAFTGLANLGYWILPKPVDMGMILHRALDTSQSFRTFPELEKVMEVGAVDFGLSVLSSLAFSVVTLALAARQLAKSEY